MTKISKARKEQNAILADQQELVTLEDAVLLVKKCAKAKFDETIDLDIRLGIDPRHSEQTVSGSIALPHGTGKNIRVVVFTQDDRAQEALDAGADQVGSEPLIQEVLRNGKLNANVVVASPDIMPKLAKIARILGPRGLMPNPKFGTVASDIAKAVKIQKAGQIRFRNDKGANIHISIGKVSFPEAKLCENARYFLSELEKLRPESMKGTYILAGSISSTLGPGVSFSTQAKG